MLKKEVSIAIPIAQVVDGKTMQTILTLVNYASKNGINIKDIGITERVLIDDARNMLTETFLESDTEWILWLDSDMTFPRETLVSLFNVAEKTGSKMVTGIYYQRKGLNYPVLWSRGDELEGGNKTGVMSPRAATNKYVGTFIFPNKDKKEPFKVHAAGFGCVLIHRSVFEVLPRPWFQFIKGVCSEDFYFFINAQEAGYELWADPTLDLGHIGDAPIITKRDFWTKATKANIEVDTLKKQEKI